MTPDTLTLGQLIFVIRRRLKLKSSENIFVYVKNQLVVPTMTLKEAHHSYSDDDGFLYVMYDFENTFG